MMWGTMILLGVNMCVSFRVPLPGTTYEEETGVGMELSSRWASSAREDSWTIDVGFIWNVVDWEVGVSPLERLVVLGFGCCCVGRIGQ